MSDNYLKLKRNKSPKGKLSPGGLSPNTTDYGSIGTKGIAQYKNPAGGIEKFNASVGDATGMGTSSGATNGACEALNSQLMDRQKLLAARQKIAQICSIPANSVQLYPDGKFHIYNIAESDALRIKSRLLHNTAIKDVSLTQGQYDFGHFNRMLQPTIRQNVSGVYIGENLITEASVGEIAGDVKNTLGGFGKAALTDFKAVSKGTKQQAKDNLYFEDTVARFLIQALKQRKSVLFIFNGRGSYTQDKLKDWVETCCGHFVDIFVGSHEVLDNPYSREQAEKELDQYVARTQTLFGGEKVSTFKGLGQKFSNYLASASNSARRHGKDLNSNIAALLQGFYPTALTGTIDDALVYLVTLALANASNGNELLNNVLKALEPSIQRLNRTDRELIINLRSACDAYVNNKSKKAKDNTNILNPKILEDKKYNKRFVVILSNNDEELVSKHEQAVALFKDCIRLDLNDKQALATAGGQGNNKAADQTNINNESLSISSNSLIESIDNYFALLDTIPQEDIITFNPVDDDYMISAVEDNILTMSPKEITIEIDSDDDLEPELKDIILNIISNLYDDLYIDDDSMMNLVIG